MNEQVRRLSQGKHVKENLVICYANTTTTSNNLFLCFVLLVIFFDRKANIVEHMLKMMEKHSSRLEDMVRVRMGELENEKKKKEALIHRMLPP